MKKDNEETNHNEHYFTPEILEVVKILTTHTHKALILYLLQADENPREDLINLLKEMAAHNYLCFLCCYSSDHSSLKRIETLGQNLFLIHQGLSIMPVFKNLSGIILSTQDIPPDWTEILPHKFIWFHANVSFVLNTDDPAADNLDKADLITYSKGDKKSEVSLSSDPRSLSLNLTAGNSQNSVISVEKRLNSTPKGWQIYANLNLQGKIAVMTQTFFDFEGEFFYSGGAERYLLDLAKICEALGRELIIFQYGNYPWMRRINNIDVISLSRAGIKAEGWILQCAKAFNRIFYEQVQARTVLNIYSAFFEAWPLAATPNIGISHGIAWDNPYCCFENAFEFWLMNERHIQGAKACETLVSVDTNSANWFQTVNFDLGQKTKVIPNYVDLTKFKPRVDYLKSREKRVILYPRQLYSARGLDLVLDVVDDILEKYPEVEFHFVGRGGEQAIAQVQDKQKKWQERIKCYSMSMDEMPLVYQAADISLIPSIHSEGTSLSCLEAMASGNAVIATRIGGLSDLIINNYNGLLIDPQSDELKRAIIYLLESDEQLFSFKQKSLEVAQAFSKKHWCDRWESLIKNSILPDTNGPPSNKTQLRQTVEIKLKDDLIDYGKLGELITPLLIEGCLIYIRTKTVPDRFLSFARVQWLASDTPLFSPCDSTIIW